MIGKLAYRTVAFSTIVDGVAAAKAKDIHAEEDTMNTGKLSIELSALAPLLDQQNFTAYWESGLELLCRHTGAQGARLRLLDSQAFLVDNVLCIGTIPVERQKVIAQWEEALLTSEEQLDLEQQEWPPTIDYSHVVDGQGQEPEIIHIHLVVESFLRGAVSLSFADAGACAPFVPNRQRDTELGSVFRLFAGNGLRAQELQSTRARLDQANLLYQISQAITSTLDLKLVFHQTTEMAASILQAQAATLFSIDTKRRQLVFMVAKGAAAQVLEEQRIPLEQGVVGWVAMNGRPLVVNNTRDNDLFNSQVDSQTGFSTRNILCVPLRIHDRTVGVLEVLNKEIDGGFTSEDADWLSAMGQHIAIALENAQLYENLRREQERIIKAQEEVRNQLARELHDNTAQMLSLIIMNLDLARQLLGKQNLERLDAELQRIEEFAKQANREVRTLLFELRPIILESRGLVPALHAYHRQLQGSMNSRIHLNADPLNFETSLQGASIIFSIIQEAVNNVRKHARAKNIWIRVHADAEHLHFAIEDDGVGFDFAEVTEGYAERGSFGLLNMRERAAMLAGYLDVKSPRSEASSGTLITGFVPLSSMIGSQEK